MLHGFPELAFLNKKSRKNIWLSPHCLNKKNRVNHREMHFCCYPIDLSTVNKKKNNSHSFEIVLILKTRSWELKKFIINKTWKAVLKALHQIWIIWQILTWFLSKKKGNFLALFPLCCPQNQNKQKNFICQTKYWTKIGNYCIYQKIDRKETF